MAVRALQALRGLGPQGMEGVSEMTGKGRPPSKSNVEKWIKQTAKNDKDHGRDSKKNPNNTKNGK
jgi:hypothetical protein